MKQSEIFKTILHNHDQIFFKLEHPHLFTRKDENSHKTVLSEIVKSHRHM